MAFLFYISILTNDELFMFVCIYKNRPWRGFYYPLGFQAEAGITKFAQNMHRGMLSAGVESAIG